MSQQPATPDTSSSDGEILWGFWYPVLRSQLLRGRELVTTTRLEVPLAIGRDVGGKAFALRDVCPHRAYPLSAGHFDGQNVECAYHGWQFDAQTGQCRTIPSITADSKLQCERIYAGSYPAEERDGYVWAYFAEPEGRPVFSGGRPFEAQGKQAQPGSVDRAALPPVPELPKPGERYRMAHLTANLNCSMDTGIVGLMDPAHGPFVHQSWWWRSRRSIREKEKTFEPIPNGFRMSAHTPSANSGPYKLLRFYGDEVTTQIDFVLPNVRTELVRCGKYFFSNRTTVTPIRRDLCRLDFCAAWNLFPWLPIGPLLQVFGKRFIAQDQRVIDAQQPGLKVQPKMMLIDDADRQARWYFELKEALLASRRTGQPMVHPMPGPVTLRWRS
jgi:phenylpropionate dioxygenase-like ring-hydroxylating dioxygenase large terminal subunit